MSGVLGNSDRPDADGCAPMVWRTRRNGEPRRTFSPLFGSEGRVRLNIQRHLCSRWLL